MEYVSPWEWLSDALKRVMATGIAEDKAKVDLCRAISDRRIKFQFLVKKGIIPPGKNVGAENVAGTRRDSSYIDIPRLKQSDFDWPHSRPLIQFQAIGPGHFLADYWEIDEIEVDRQEVTNELLGNPAPASPSDSKRAPEETIRAAIRDVYIRAEATPAKPPNIRELPSMVIAALKLQGYAASARQIAKIGSEPEFRKRRRPTGTTVSSERGVRKK